MSATAGSRARRDGPLLAVAVAGISLSGPLIAATAAPALAIAFWRNALGVAALAPAAALRPRLRAEAASVRGRALLLSLASGAALAAHFALWLPSLSLTSVASSVALVTTTPLWTAVLLRLTGRRPPAAVWAGSLLAFAGVLALTGVDLAASPRALAGDALALAGGITSAVYVLLGAEVRRTTSTTAYTLWCYGTAAALLLAACLAAGVSLGLGGGAGGYPAETWLRLLALTAASQLLGHSLLNRVVRGLGPSVTSTALLLETPGAALVAAAWLGQAPPAAAWPALALILLGLALVVRAERAPGAPPSAPPGAADAPLPRPRRPGRPRRPERPERGETTR
ncbi:EamA family transporter [Streptomyces sp. DSM 44917]|uniref:EamA family transporter n=1 Tax=Streptomyces boetiae TaxID=3075541 RepID=A0ABU2L7Y9_9ACTN|nr:EamA family transporter [Streptomyces sp. DSM 44917]MDT0307685.1 EamA family transporter [Streptomyces sp. DSM 44917]